MKTKKKHKIWRWLLLLMLLVWIGWSLYCSKYRLEVTQYEYTHDTIPERFDGYRIVQLSDLHAMEFGENNEVLLQCVRELEPDLITLTGDYIECAEDIPITENLVKALVEIAPVTFNSGNHDWASGAALELRESIENAGGTYLANTWFTETREDQSIIIAGVEDPNSYADMIRPDELMEQIEREHPDTFTILMGHRNDWPIRYPELDADLIFCGHGHGGIIRLPGVGGLLGTDHRFFPEYDGGMYDCGAYTMAVSRGLGNNFWVPRFLNQPEVLCLTLHNS